MFPAGEKKFNDSSQRSFEQQKKKKYTQKLWFFSGSFEPGSYK